jgi:hypothetical protein
MQFPCPYGWNGNIAGTCNTNGILGYANNCTLDNDSCINLEGGRENSRTLACPLGQTGYVHQYCNGTNWVNVINNCSNLSCGSVAIGDDNNTTNIDCNNVNYTKDSTIANKIPESCAIAGNSSTIANNNNLTIGVHEVCRPSYQSGNCVVGDTRNIGCPRGHMGEHIQQCISNNGALGLYHTLTNSCRPVTCNDGSPIGTVKATSRAKCNQGEVGTVYEICTLNGSQNAAFWQLSFRNCNKQHCRNNFDSITHNSGMATYNDGAMAYEANNNYTASSCPNVNYSINNASRRCGFDGYWYSRNKACAAASNCPQLASINTGLTNMTWAQAVGGLVPPEHGEYKVITLMAPGNIGNHRCSPSYEVSDNVKLICNSRGQWVDFCNSAAYQTVINNRISLISTQEHQFNSNRLQDAGGVNINFYRDSDNNNVCNASTINFDRMHCQICHAGVCSYAD